jgi:hypothetical protein
MSEKLFTIVGVSKLDDVYKLRFANDIMRIKMLLKKGHTDVRLAQLPNPLNKYQAVQAISQMDEFQDYDAQITIQDYLSMYEEVH